MTTYHIISIHPGYFIGSRNDVPSRIEAQLDAHARPGDIATIERDGSVSVDRIHWRNDGTSPRWGELHAVATDR